MIKELQEFTEAQKTISKYNSIFVDMVKDFTATWRAHYWFERIEIAEDKCTVWCDETIMGDTETNGMWKSNNKKPYTINFYK